MDVIRIPTGTRDVLPAEAAETRFLMEAVRTVFTAFGYGEVVTPTLELESALEVSGEKRFRRSFRLFDEKGEVMMLRPEMTTPIARLAATKLAGRQPPFRFCYFANSFQPTRPQRGRQSEFFQAGLELIGIDSPAADGEVLAVLCGALEACGLREYSISLGEASFFRALLEEVGVSDEEQERLFMALAERDMVEFAHLVGALAVDDEDRQAILDAVALRGGSDVLTRAQDLVRGPRMEKALKRLARTYYLVSRYGYAGRLLFDLGILRGFDYYTGIVFEVVSGDLGFPIGGGGRYDNLLARFGRDEPAVGFALGLDRLHIAVSGQGGVPLQAGPGVALAGGMDEELDLARELRESGVKVLSLPADITEQLALEAARDAGLGYAVLPLGDGIRLLECAGGQARDVSREQLAAAVEA
ncbi:MAG: ATP phosphoribosyltransferase regulatory subunit [Gaiellales bacterium]|nr:MAG: ATP phosphoribosyltransferase regulatory subunit [Gaiellales bacterium]